jgi:hypothetical protein
MRYLAPAELLEAVAAALREVVLPDCASRHVAGQLWAAIGILDNLAATAGDSQAGVDAERMKLMSWLAAHEPSGRPHADSSLTAARDSCRELLAAPGAVSATAMNDLREVLAELAEDERSGHKPVNFIAAFEQPAESAQL